jgi:hypothetical protein
MHKLVSQERVAFGCEPIVLVGPPDGCEGLIQLHNPAPEPVKIRRLRLRSHDEALQNCCDPGVLELQLSAVLCAGGSAQERVTLQLPAATPPGTYDATLEGAEGRAQQVHIHVLEERRTELAPASITRSVCRGETFSVPLHVINDGNVAIEIPRFGAVEMHDGERDWMHHFHAVASAHGDEGYALFLDQFIARMGANEPPLGRARVTAGAGPLAAQTGRLIELCVSLPKKLRTHHKYRARLAIADAALELILHVGDKPETESTDGVIT